MATHSPGGLGVMEGKAILMKYLGGVDGVALCIEGITKGGRMTRKRSLSLSRWCSRSSGPSTWKIFPRPNCFKVLDMLREECDIPVWHDNAQGTASVTLAGA